jgi:sec-independent protein translocase protein TatA
MGQFSLVHWLILGIVLVLVLGGGRFSNMMGDVAKGIKQFKKGMSEEDDAPINGTTGSREPDRIEAKKSADPAFDRDGNRVREDR